MVHLLETSAKNRGQETQTVDRQTTSSVWASSRFLLSVIEVMNISRASSSMGDKVSMFDEQWNQDLFLLLDYWLVIHSFPFPLQFIVLPSSLDVLGRVLGSPVEAVRKVSRWLRIIFHFYRSDDFPSLYFGFHSPQVHSFWSSSMGQYRVRSRGVLIYLRVTWMDEQITRLRMHSGKKEGRSIFL